MQEQDIQTQAAAIKAALLNGQAISPMDALHLCGCYRLSARIYDLRHDEGMVIQMTQDKKRHYAIYWMNKADIAEYNRNHVQAK